MSIRDDFFDKKNKAALWDVGVSINRTNPLPIDKNSVFDTVENLNTYVNGVLSYPGQLVALVEEAATKVYYISIENNEKVLKQINTGGGSGVGITIVNNLTSESKTDALSAYQGKVLNENKLDKDLLQTGHIYLNGGSASVVPYNGSISSINTEIFKYNEVYPQLFTVISKDESTLNNISVWLSNPLTLKLEYNGYQNTVSVTGMVNYTLLNKCIESYTFNLKGGTISGNKYAFSFQIFPEKILSETYTPNISFTLTKDNVKIFTNDNYTSTNAYDTFLAAIKNLSTKTSTIIFPEYSLTNMPHVSTITLNLKNISDGDMIYWNGQSFSNLSNLTNKNDFTSVYKVKGSLNPTSEASPYVNNWAIGIPKNGDVYNILENNITGLGNSISYNSPYPECTYTDMGNYGILQIADKNVANQIGNCSLILSPLDNLRTEITVKSISTLSNPTFKVDLNTELTSGTTYYIKRIQRDRVSVNKGDNVVWVDGYGWDKLAADIDLSNYVTKNDIYANLNTTSLTATNITTKKIQITGFDSIIRITDNSTLQTELDKKANTTDLDSKYTPCPFWERNKRYNLNQIVCHDDESSGRIGFYKWTVSSEIPNSDLDLTVPPYGDNNWEPISLKNALTDSDGNKITETYVKKSDIGTIEGGKTSLKDISNGGCISVIDCGFVNDGTTDNSAKLTTVLEQYPNSTLYFPKGTYSFSSSIVFEHCHVILDSATLKYTGSETIDSFISVKGEILSEENETPLGGMFFVGIGNSHDNILDGNLKAKNIIRWTRQKGFQLKNIKICNFSESGIQTKWDIPNYTGENYSYESHISDCYIENNLIYSAYGIIENGGDAVVKDIVMLNVKKGILCGNSGTLYNNIHVWNYNWGSASKTAEENLSLMSDTIFADVTVDGVRFINCYLDTCQKGFNMRVGVNSILVSNSFWYINSGTWITNLTPYVFYFVDGHNTTPKIYMSQCNIDNGCGLAFSNKTLDSNAAILLNTICEATGTPKTSINLTKFSNDVNANNFTITNLPNPTEASQVANKSYIDAVIKNAILELTDYVDTQIEENLGDKVECTGLTLSANSLTLYDGGTSQTLIATKEPTNCTQRIRWTTSNVSVASVVNGVVTPKGFGNCVITAICGSYQASCSVNVLYAGGVYAKNFTPTGTFSYDLACDFDAGQYVEVSIDVSKITDTTKSYLIFSLGNDITAWGSGYTVNDYYVKGTGVHNITVTYPTQESIDNYPNTSTVSTFVYQIKSDGIYLNNNKLEFSQSNAETFYNTVVNNWKSDGIVKFGNVIESDELGDITEVTYNYIKVVS